MRSLSTDILIAVFLILGFPLMSFGQELTVAVAANVQYTFEELKREFESAAGITVTPVYGSSGKFATQVENGAPFDIFISADMEYPKKLEEKGLTSNNPKVYAYGTLVLWTVSDVDLSKGIEIIADPVVKKIAIASPDTAPYGRQAVNAMKHYGLYKDVHNKLVYGESIAQTNQFITSQAAGVGFTAKSIVLAANMKDQGKWIEIDKAAYEPIAQGAVILKHAQKNNLQEAQKFFDFLYSPRAQEIFEKYGYILPQTLSHE